MRVMSVSYETLQKFLSWSVENPGEIGTQQSFI